MSSLNFNIYFEVLQNAEKILFEINPFTNQNGVYLFLFPFTGITSGSGIANFESRN